MDETRATIICRKVEIRPDIYMLVPEEVGEVKMKGLKFQTITEEEIPSFLDPIALRDKDTLKLCILDLPVSILKQRYQTEEIMTILGTYYKEVARYVFLATVNGVDVKLNPMTIEEVVSNFEITEETRKSEANIPPLNQNAPAKLTVITKKQSFDDSLKHINNIELENYLKARIINNDEVIENIVTTIAMNYRATKPENIEQILSMGGTGCGKTETFKLIGQYIGIPVTIYDCNNLTAAGYVGNDVQDALKMAYFNSNKDLKIAERSILVFDEVDKLASRGSEVKDLEVQHALLKLIEGFKYQIELNKMGSSITMDTSFMTKVALGAFTEMFDNIRKEKNNTGIGFNPTAIVTDNTEILDVTTDDLIKYGMLQEFIGRFNNRYVYHEMNVDTLKKILLSSDLSPLIVKQRRYKEEFNIDLSWEDEFIELIAEEAIKLKTGARSLKEMVTKFTKTADREILIKENTSTPAKKLILTKDTFEDPTNFKLS